MWPARGELESYPAAACQPTLGRRPGGNLRPNELIETAVNAEEYLQFGARLLGAGLQPSLPHRSLAGFAHRAVGMNCFLHGHDTDVTD
jgi:hypothetical protein